MKSREVLIFQIEAEEMGNKELQQQYFRIERCILYIQKLDEDWQVALGNYHLECYMICARECASRLITKYDLLNQ